MKTKEVFVQIDGEAKSMMIGERTHRQAMEIRELAAVGTKVTRSGEVIDISGEQGIKVLDKQIETGIKKYPDGITSYEQLSKKISAQDGEMLAEEIHKLNNLGDTPKKSETQ